jgi:hypothetical protein
MGEGVSVVSASGVSVASTGIVSVFVGGRVRVCGNSVIEFSELGEDKEHAVNRAVKTNKVKRKAEYLKILWGTEE